MPFLGHLVCACASHCSTCVAETRERGPEHIGGTKRGALVPRRQPSPRSVVFRRRPENKVFRLVARQNPFTEGVLAAPPSLKVKATDTALIFPMKSQYRLPMLLFRGRCPGKLRSFIGETVGLPKVFSHPRKYFCFI